MLRTERPPRLPAVLLEALFPSPQLLTGRLAASTVAMYTRDCAAYVAFCGYDGVLAGQAETVADLAYEREKREALAPRRRLLGLAVVERLGA